MRQRLRLIAHKFPEFIPCKRSSFIKYDPLKIFIECNFPDLQRVETKMMSFLRFFGVKFKKLDGFSSASPVPAICKQYTANIGEDRSERSLFFHPDNLEIFSR